MSKLAILVAQLKNPPVAVLVVAAAISLIAGKEIDSIVIGAVIAFNTVIGFFQESRAEAALEALKSRAAPEADGIRRATGSGEAIEMQIPAIVVVPSDVLMLHAGDRIPADARIPQAYNLEINESMLTGESLAVAKVTRPLPAERKQPTGPTSPSPAPSSPRAGASPRSHARSGSRSPSDKS